jgi:hypothetical protein
MRYAIVALLALTACGHYGPTKHETGVVVEKQYFPDTRQTVTGTGFSTKGSLIMTSHVIGDHEKYMVIFKCDHGVVFSVNRADVYGRVEKGDKVNIAYQEYLNKSETEILDLRFIDALVAIK